MRRQPLPPEESLESFILTELMPKLIELQAYGVSQLDVDLTEMSIRLRLPPRADKVQILITSDLPTTDPPEAA